MKYGIIGVGAIGGYYMSKLEMLESELRFLPEHQQ
jgi:ketopantoate reductase